MPTPSKQKKSLTTKTIKRKKQIKKRKKLFSLKQKISTLFCLFFLVSAFTYGYYLGGKNSKDLNQSTEKKILVKELKVKTNKVHSVAKQCNKPKLVIIIDDIHTKSQLANIEALGLHITPSIFPPYKLAPNSHKLASNLKHFMIHLPMESKSKQLNSQYKTLKINYSDVSIKNRIAELRVLFPNAKYINNHTGSVFTSNYDSMSSAYAYMKKYKFKFVDSKTSKHTKVKQIAKEHKDKYVARDVFLDNKREIEYIKLQLKKAVSIAQKRGYAIAIGHPHYETMKALASSKNILDFVDVIYIDELF